MFWEVAKIIEVNIQFGENYYSTENKDNTKIVSTSPTFKKVLKKTFFNISKHIFMAKKNKM